MGKKDKPVEKASPAFFVNSTKALLSTSTAGALTSFASGTLHLASGMDSLNKVMDMLGRQSDVPPELEFEMQLLSVLLQNAQDRAASSIRTILQLADHLGEGVLVTVMSALGIEQASIEEQEQEVPSADFAVDSED